MDELIKENLEISSTDLLTSKGLYDNNSVNDKYLMLFKKYKILLDKYLVNKLELNIYDKAIDDSKLSFVPVISEKMDYYQYISSMGLKYFYLRNNIYVEKLSQENIDKILKLSDDELKNPSEEIIKLIEDTYSDIIDVKNEKDVTYMVCYGPDSDRFWFESDELVIGFRFDDFADNGLGEDDEWEENRDNQITYVNGIMNQITENANKVLKVKTDVVWYNDFTVKEAVKLKNR